jgi:hypothetical protein
MSEKVCVIVSVRQSSPMGNVVKPTASMSGRKKSAQAKATVCPAMVSARAERNHWIEHAGAGLGGEQHANRTHLSCGKSAEQLLNERQP